VNTMFGAPPSWNQPSVAIPVSCTVDDLLNTRVTAPAMLDGVC
jgi:hypothetical protein